MYTENGETKFRMLPNGDCPFLNRQHLCDIYSCLGREHLSRTCALYPRYINEFGAHRETGLSMSCPEAVRIIMSQTSPVSYCEIKTDEKLRGYNSIDPIKYMCLKTARSHILDILQDRSRSINLRLANALDYAEYIEKMVHRRAYGKIDYSHIPRHETISGHNCKKLINAWFSHLDKMEF